MSMIRILKDARALIEKGWTQGAYARNARGERVRTNDKSAVQFCPLGACMRTAPSNSFNAMLHLEAAIDTLHVAGWNDDPERTKDEVLGAFDVAIKLAEMRRDPS